jgi:hypothetical protein
LAGIVSWSCHPEAILAGWLQDLNVVAGGIWNEKVRILRKRAETSWNAISKKTSTS